VKILIASSIHADAIAQLKQNHDVICQYGASEDELMRLIVDREVLVFRSGVQISAAVMSAAPDLKLLLRAGSGVDNIDMEYVEARGLELVRIPGPGAKAVAELSFAFMLALSRNLLIADSKTRRGEWAKSELTGYLLTGKRLGIVGAGNIGTRTGELGAAWGMDVVGCVEYPNQQVAEQLARRHIRLTTFEEVLRISDYVSIHVPLQPSTRHMVDARALAWMKPSAYLVNLARGGVVDEQALYEALTTGRLAGAALDVHAQEGAGKVSPLAGLPNVILTPHIGAGTYDSQREIGEIVLQQVESYVRSRQPLAVSA
jgi:D-3-phosphoglycerate dehydrogenase / 2-oxoglutarate reductase